MTSNFQTTTLIAGALLLLILFVSAGYFQMLPLENDAGDNTASEELADNYERWQENRPAAFRYVVERTCACAPEFLAPYVASEESGTRLAEFIVEIESADGSFLGAPPQAMWVEDLFAAITTAIEGESGVQVEVRYDTSYGYPRELALIASDPSATLRYEVRDFEVLQHRTTTE